MKHLLKTLLFVPLLALAGTVTPTWTFTDFGLDPLTIKTMRVTPLAPYGTNSGGIITGDWRDITTDGAGSVTLTNIQNGYSYRVEFNGPSRKTSFTNSFPSTATNAVNAWDYMSVSVITQEGLSAYSQTQANARFIARNSGTGTNVSLFGTNTIAAISLGGVVRSTWPSGTGGSSYSNNAGLPGVISADAIGTNTTHLLPATNAVAYGGLSVSNSAFNLLNGDGAAFGLRHLEDYLNLSAEGVSWQFDTFGDDAGTLRGTMFDASTSMTLNGVTITEWPGASDMTSKLNTVNGHATNLTSVDLLVTNVLGVVFTNDSSGIVAYNASLVPVFYVNNAGTTTSSNFTALDGVTIGGVKRTTWPTSGGPLGMLTNGTYYVSAAEGDDDTGDGTINNPWFTPTNAIAQVTSGLIVVDGGQYQFTITGKNNVHWQLATDCIIGSSNVIAGPTFTATNGVAFSVIGGSVLATNQSFRTTGSGTIHMVSSRVYPPVVFTNSITGYWTE